MKDPKRRALAQQAIIVDWAAISPQAAREALLNIGDPGIREQTDQQLRRFSPAPPVPGE